MHVVDSIGKDHAWELHDLWGCMWGFDIVPGIEFPEIKTGKMHATVQRACQGH